MEEKITGNWKDLNFSNPHPQVPEGASTQFWKAGVPHSSYRIRFEVSAVFCKCTYPATLGTGSGFNTLRMILWGWLPSFWNKFSSHHSPLRHSIPSEPPPVRLSTAGALLLLQRETRRGSFTLGSRTSQWQSQHWIFGYFISSLQHRNCSSTLSGYRMYTYPFLHHASCHLISPRSRGREVFVL